MNIEAMKIEDYEETYQLWTAIEGMGLRSLDDSENGIARFLCRNPNTSFICRMEGKVVGAILCGNDGRRGYIYHLAVDESFRKKGIGRLLVDAVLDALEKEGINKAALVVYADNEVGNRFWESLGFLQREDLNYRNKTINKTNI